MKKYLNIRAGKKAFESIRSGAFNPEKIKILAGASGGPKWLVLSGIDLALAELFKNRKTPLITVGSSIGSWRMAALAQKNPVAAITAFEDAYINQQYSKSPSPSEVTEQSYNVLDSYLDNDGIDYALSHPFMRMYIIASKDRFKKICSYKAGLCMTLASAATANLINRNLLFMFFDRVVFCDNRISAPFMKRIDYKKDSFSLSKENLRDAIMASGSIPLVMKGINNIDGADGVFRDGGVIDYHLDIPFGLADDEIVLFPHFYNKIIPGWFDKNLSWKKPNQHNIENVVLISPSKEFMNLLPYKKIPDRNDFYTFNGNDAARISYWRKVVELNRLMGRELVETLESKELFSMIEPL